MAMLEEHRNTIYRYFTTRLGKEATQALLSYFPSRDLDDPATKADLQLVRAEIQLVQADVEPDSRPGSTSNWTSRGCWATRGASSRVRAMRTTAPTGTSAAR